jgi:16S rRNA (uracil1498-N3)-methyltransferase
MTRRRWIADEVQGKTAALTGEHALHLSRVLRAQVGQQFDIATGDAVRRGTITAISDGRVEFALGEELDAAPLADLTLYLAIFKFDRLEWAIEKCTELGVARIVPVIARRTDTHLAAAADKRRERWQRLALQASEQSRRAAPPEIAHPVKLKEAINILGACVDGLRIVLAESEETFLLRDLLREVLQERSSSSASLTIHSAPVHLAIGPEGGWAEDELVLLKGAGWISASLGPTILRAETAAIAATAIAISALS